MKNYFVQSSLTKIAKMLADKYGLVVTFSGGTPRTNGSEIILPAISDELPAETQQDLLSFVVHEVSHILYTDMTIAESFTMKYGKSAFELLNALEDGRVEHRIEQEYLGAKRLFQESNKRVTKEFETSSHIPSNFRQFCAIAYLISKGYAIPSNWDKNIQARVETYKNLIEEAIHAKSTQEVADVALKIMEDLDSSQERDSDNSTRDNSGSNQDTSCSSDSDTNNLEKGDTDARSDAHGSNVTTEDIKSNYNEVRQESIRSQCDEILSHTDVTTYRRYDESVDLYQVVPEASNAKVQKEQKAIRPYVHGIRSKLITALVAQGKSRYLSNQERGMIDSSKLPQLITGSSDKIFKIKTNGRSKKTTVTLLIDASGSMGGTQIQVARSVAMVFTEVLDKAHITSRVIGFDGTSFPYGEEPKDYHSICSIYSEVDPVRYSILKDFNEPFTQVKARFPSLDTGGTTPLAPALIQEIRLLLKHECDRRILFVLTDGQPSCNSHDDICKNICHDILTQGTRAGVETVGIGIGLDVSEVFESSVQIDDIADLPKTVLNQLYKILTRRY